MTSPSFNRPGAVDLSNLAQASRQGGQAPAGRSWVLDVTVQTFNDLVARSQQHPVVLEITSPRAQGAAALSRDLADLAQAAQGKFLLGRVDVDVETQIAQALGVQQVPVVIGVLMGQPVPLFQGVLPREQIQAYLDQLLQAAVANGVVGTAEPVQGAAESAADEPDPRFAAADEALERGDYAAAEAEFDKLLAADPRDAEAAAGKAQAGLLARTAGVDPQAVLAAAEAAPQDLAAVTAAADVEVVLGTPERAFERLIGFIRVSAGDDREEARKRLLALFETVGGNDPRVLKARRALTTALF
ncbi:tetratricopeptide repeat protein [Auraticoccus sp. F435]|uniref:Tetratricopeptide repeat protein n=1 Tax=Auraticoccus cholistanensis TaxID=2656650 RepID=A0A6A9UXK0_9ACTN|nr:tetratricopeptide repeat protein [Auraticoccus cholistanensis]MVA76017.1 tetratricopeptide repeat protein [Auraticoccus cholistanensis]